MPFVNFSLFIICSLIFLTSCFSQKEILDDKFVQNDTTGVQQKLEEKEVILLQKKVSDANIKTVLCHKFEEVLSLPIINLNSDDKLLISFDDLDADVKDYYYTIIHCNTDWTASDLMQSEYINGFTEEPIIDYVFSFNTIQKYTHYKFEFPTINMRPLLSGNYVFKIYTKKDKKIIHKRFMVLDTKLSVEANVKRATIIEDRSTKHEIDFTIKHPNLVVADPFSDIKVHIKQNNKEDNAIIDLSPLFVKNNELVYEYDEGNTFWGNNEFRHFDIKSLRYQSERIKNIVVDTINYHVYLFNDYKRPFDRYSIEQDINGKFLVTSQEAWKSSVEADYAYVHFTLPVDHISYGDLYVLGALTDWQLKEEFKLKYNAVKKQYEKAILLKQGYYNYHYALNDTITGRVDVSFIEGTHYQTRNDYYIYVYYRGVGDRYDRLVGFLKTSSKELF